MIAFACARCEKTFHVKDEFAGRKTKCPKCGASLLVPGTTGPATSTPVPPPVVKVAPPPLAVVPPAPPPVVIPEVLPWPSIDEYKDCPLCGERVLAKARKCKHCGEMLDAPPVPRRVKYDQSMDTFSGTMLLMVKLAMRAIQELGWKLDAANETLGMVTFQTGISWGSWSGVSCSLNIEEVTPSTFRVTGTGKQNVRGGQLIALNIGGEAQSKARMAIDKMRQLAV